MTFPQGVSTQTLTLDTLTNEQAEGTEYLTAMLTAVDPRVSVVEPNAVVFITEDGKKLYEEEMEILGIFISLCMQWYQQYHSQPATML